MANELTTTEPADGRHALAWRALSLLPSTTANLAERLADDGPACLDAAIAKVEHDLRPVPTDAAARAEWEKAIDERLRRLAVKVLPTARPADTVEWRKAMTEALSNLPAMVSLTAAKRAIHRAYRFVGDIEPVLREIADEIVAERGRALAALRRHRAEIEAALEPAPALPAGPDCPAPSPEQLAKVNAFLRRGGLRTQFNDDGTTFQRDDAADADQALDREAA